MIKNLVVWEKFEKEQIEKDSMSYEEKLNLLEDFIGFATKIGVFSEEDFMEDILNHQKIERIFNAFKKSD
ncbi:MAG: hypothetical protein ACP5QT_07765 [Brevinematia bacterium]